MDKRRIPGSRYWARKPLPGLHHARYMGYLLQMKLGLHSKSVGTCSKGAHGDWHGWAHGCLPPQLKVEVFKSQFCIVRQPWVTKLLSIAHVSFNELSWEWITAHEGVHAMLQTTCGPLSIDLLCACRDLQGHVLLVACNVGTADNTTFPKTTQHLLSSTQSLPISPQASKPQGGRDMLQAALH